MGESGTSSSTGTTTDDHVKGRLEDLDPEVVAAMTADELKKFIETGRTGRRNALADVNQPGIVSTSTAGVAEAMESLSVQGRIGNTLDEQPKIQSRPFMA